MPDIKLVADVSDKFIPTLEATNNLEPCSIFNVK